MKPLKLEELTVEQKIGLLMVVRGFIDEEDREFVYQMMEKRSIGGIQIPPRLTDYRKEVAGVKAHTDYPILIVSDMENGFPTGEYNIPSAMALSITGDEELAYQFGAVTAIEARRNGYNTVWGTIADLVEGDNMSMIPRSYGGDPQHVSRMTSAVLRGYRDYGMLGGLKHWPNPPDSRRDTHVFDEQTKYTEEDIMSSVIVPYVHAMKQGILGCVMSDHTCYPNIDPVYPATLSEKLIGILRRQGYDGLIFTDSFGMLGVLQNFGEDKCYGLAIKAGNDMVLPNYRVAFKTSYEYLLKAYQDGVFTEERLNEAVGRVIAAQNATLEMTAVEEVTEYQKECFERIRKDSISLIKDDNVPAALDKERRKLFVLVKENYYKDENGLEYEITSAAGIHDKNTDIIKAMILAKFPGSLVEAISQYPNAIEIENICKAAIDVEEVIFLTYASSDCYTLGGDYTPRILHLMDALRKKLTTVIHLGNPYPLEQAPHLSRILISIGGREKSIEYCLSVLNGEYVPKGKLPFSLNLK